MHFIFNEIIPEILDFILKNNNINITYFINSLKNKIESDDYVNKLKSIHYSVYNKPINTDELKNKFLEIDNITKYIPRSDPNFLELKDESFKIYINSLLTLKILFKYFHKDVYSNIFGENEKELSFIINDNIQNSFFDILKILIIRFLKYPVNSIIDYQSLNNSFNNLTVPSNNKYTSEIQDFIQNINVKNVNYFLNKNNFNSKNYSNINNDLKYKKSIIKVFYLFNKIIL